MPPLVVQTVRFYRAETGLTRVKTFVDIPYSLLEPGEDSARRKVYKVMVKLADSTGLTLLHQEWWNHARGDVQAVGASTVEILDFAVAPGSYGLHVVVQDSVSGRSVEADCAIDGFGQAPGASDLWLSPRMRPLDDGDSVPAPGEVREGSAAVTAVGRLILTPLRSTAYYLVEAYSPKRVSGEMSVAVVDSLGKTLVHTKPMPVEVLSGGAVLKGGMDLAGLPGGRYTMHLSLAFGGDTLHRSAELIMKGLGETLERDVAERDAARVTDEGYFASLSAAQLDEAMAPLIYIAESGELKGSSKDLSPAAKRKFLTNFWARRDPSPGTLTNEARERFYGMLGYANRTFKEGGRSAVPGWRSDRGRVYAKFGQPDDIFSRQQEGNAPRYEVWRYTRRGGRYYVFADRTGFGAYALIATNDVKETGVANWRELLTLEAVEDVGRFLGINLVAR